MANKTDRNIFDYELVAVEAKQLVDEVLEEACGVVNTANISKDPWKYISCLKKYKCQDDVYSHNLTFVINKDYLKNFQLDDSIITSTPQKGQGDDEVTLTNENSAANSTTAYISKLFDITELVAADEEETIEHIKESDVPIVDGVAKIIDHCVDLSICKVLTSKSYNNEIKEPLKQDSDHLNQLNLSENVNEFNDTNESNAGNETHVIDASKTHGKTIDKKTNENIYLDDLCSYENAYLSLNRDYEQDYYITEPKLQDQRKFILQEVDLTPEQDVIKKVGQEYLEMPTSSKNAELVSDARKRTLGYRCRLGSRKILARLRGWLWRRTMRKYKVYRGWTEAEKGMSPSSPSAKKAFASLRDHWQIRGTFSHSAWKFNTISKVFVNSALWKELGSKVQFKRSY